MSRMLSFCLMLLCLAGCSRQPDGPARFEIKGQVTYNDKPVPYGEIVFVPDTAAGNRGPGATATITDGKYRVPSEQGVVGGPHRVTITGFTAAPSQAAVPDPSTPPSVALFAPIEMQQTLPTSSGTQNFALPIP